MDQKIPLLRAHEKLEAALSRLCAPNFLVDSHLAVNLQCFIVDRTFFLKRQDLEITGRILYENVLEDSSIRLSDRILSFVRAVEDVSSRLGTSCKIRLVEGSSSQYEITAKAEKVSLAADYHFLLMELMQDIAAQYDVAVLFHEKPFATERNSLMRLDWSFITSEGSNLLHLQGCNFLLLTLVIAVIHAVYEHQGLLGACVACASQDSRLGDYKVFSPVMCVDAGAELNLVIQKLLRQKDFDLSEIVFSSSENLKSKAFCVFTRNGFSFQGFKPLAQLSFFMSAIQSAVADSLELILDELSGSFRLPVLRKRLEEAQSVIFCEHIPSSKSDFHPRVFESFLEQKTMRCFGKVLNENELGLCHAFFLKHYAKEMLIEAQLMARLFRTQILPEILKNSQQRQIEAPSFPIEKTIQVFDELDKVLEASRDLGEEIQAKLFFEIGVPLMISARQFCKSF